MCVVCRGRFAQLDLLRIQCLDRKLVRYTNDGRSFYLCKGCVDNKNEKKLLKRLSSMCKKEIKIINLESILNE